MIKVTYKNFSGGLTTLEEDYIEFRKEFEDIYFFYAGTDTFEDIAIDRIVKIEKQLKDLTKQEIYKVISHCYGDELDRIVIYKNRIAVDWSNQEEKDFDEYFDDEYIDITDLVVGK